MINIKIREPLWMNGGSVGIDARINDDVVVEITHTNKSGVRVYPDIYKINKNKLSFIPVRKFKKGIPVRVVAIKDMEVCNEG